MDLSKTNECVLVVADDTDVLILLLYHSPFSKKIFMETRQHIISIKVAKEVLGRELCMCLPFAHAMSGCDTTSALFGIGKLKPLKFLQSSQLWKSHALVFSKKKICSFGQLFVHSLYSGGSKTTKGLDELRYLNVISPKFVPVERMPPTSRSCYFHSLRVHHQVSTWMNLETVLDKEDYGFKVQDKSVIPIITDMAPTPPELLLNIRCSCKTSKTLCASCSCAKKGIFCSIHCKCEAQCQNAATCLPLTDDEHTE